MNKNNAAQFLPLVQALAEGKTIQRKDAWGEWIDRTFPSFIHAPENYRVKPWQMPSPPKGFEWHRNDFTEEMLPEGWRPLLLGETDTDEDEWLDDRAPANGWRNLDLSGSVVKEEFNRRRTRRPLTAEKKRVPLEAGDCPPGSVVRGKGWLASEWGDCWCAVIECAKGGVWVNRHSVLIGWELLMHDWEIRRPNQDWEPCHKEG